MCFPVLTGRSVLAAIVQYCMQLIKLTSDDIQFLIDNDTEHLLPISATLDLRFTMLDAKSFIYNCSTRYVFLSRTFHWAFSGCVVPQANLPGIVKHNLILH